MTTGVERVGRRVKRASYTSNAIEKRCSVLQSGARMRSQRGASIILALFLFLICALLASVVLAATSAVTGRHAQLAEMDQRYYNVSSTVSLMNEEICNRADDPVVVTCEKTEERITTTTYQGDKTSEVTSPATLKNVTLKIGEKTIAEGSSSLSLSLNDLTFRQRLALCLMFQKNVADVPATEASTIWDKSLFNGSIASGGIDLGTFNLTHTVSHNNKSGEVSNAAVQDALKAKIVASIDADRVLDLNVQSNDTGSDMYAVNMECSSDTNTVERVVESAPSVTESGNMRTETVTITTTRETEVNWSLLRTEKA